jgi:hypothetical protein
MFTSDLWQLLFILIAVSEYFTYILSKALNQSVMNQPIVAKVDF